MEYRLVRPADNGFASAAEQVFAQRDHIQQTMYTSGPDEILDTLLVFANICEQRALVYRDHPTLGPWYRLMSMLLRGNLEMTTGSNGPRPDLSLENPELYFPDVEHIH
jgi:hypothetical protein